VEPVFHRTILKASLGRMSKKQQQQQNQQQQPKPSTKGKSKPEGARLNDSSIARASPEVSLDNADTVIEGASYRNASIRGRRQSTSDD
jgi:hypothetical protein